MLPQRDSILSLLADEDSDTATLVQNQLVARGADTLPDLRELLPAASGRAERRLKETIAQIAGDAAEQKFGGLDALNNFAGRLDIRNNAVYNWRGRTTDGGAMEVNFVNNYYKPGAATTLTPFALTVNHEDNFGGMQRAYFAGNVMLGYFDETTQTTGRSSVPRLSYRPASLCSSGVERTGIHFTNNALS